MFDKKNNDLLKNGIWIKQQNGVLTMGTMDDQDYAVVLSHDFSDTLFKLEKEMMQALYGPSVEAFDSEKVKVKSLINKVISEIDDKEMKFSVHCEPDTSIACNYDDIYKVIYGLIKNSTQSECSAKSIYINASLADNTLCLIYRDSGQSGNIEAIKEEIDIIRDRLNGKVNVNETGQWTYLDITIPES